MITLRVSQRARCRALSARLSRRHPRFAPICESLETRQLLSVSAFPGASRRGWQPASRERPAQCFRPPFEHGREPGRTIPESDPSRLRRESGRVQRQCRRRWRGSNDRDHRCLFRPEHRLRPREVRCSVRPVGSALIDPVCSERTGDGQCRVGTRNRARRRVGPLHGTGGEYRLDRGRSRHDRSIRCGPSRDRAARAFPSSR